MRNIEELHVDEDGNLVVYWPPEITFKESTFKNIPKNIYDPENIQELQRQKNIEYEAIIKRREEHLRLHKKQVFFCS